MICIYYKYASRCVKELEEMQDFSMQMGIILKSDYENDVDME